ncbi:MAG: potassium channel protein [Deltaproteobacteria bacterium]|nr:potassium channel protein [Deltaproteobacteria bacterium]
MNSEESSVISSFQERLKFSLYFFVAVVSVGTFGYKLIGGPDYSLSDCFYMTIITLSTVGYGEVIDLVHHPGARVFTVFLIITGMGALLYLVSTLTAFIVEGELLKIFWRKKMDKMINKMQGHYIVCGVGRVGYHIIQELSQTKRGAVAIDIKMDNIEKVRRSFPMVPTLQGDGLEDDLLKEAAIERANGMMVSTGHDKDNMVITMSARQLNPSLRIVARCNEMKNMEKLGKAGADSVVSSNFIGALRMASEMVRPTVVSFLDIMLRDKEKNLRIEEVPVKGDSKLTGKRVFETGIKKAANILLLAVKKANGDWEYNPKDDFLFEEGMDLIIMGSPEEKERLQSFIS